MAKKRTASPPPDSKAEKRVKKPEKKEPKSAAARSKAADEHAERSPVQMIHDMLARKFTSGTVKMEVAVMMTAVLEYLSAEILELSVNVARNRSNSQARALKVTLADTMEAIENDPEMKELISRAREINSGVEK